MTSPSAAGNRNALFIGGGVVALVAVVGAVFLLTSGGDDDTATAPLTPRTPRVVASATASATSSPLTTPLKPEGISTRDPLAIPSIYASKVTAAPAPATTAAAVVAPVAATAAAAPQPANPYVELLAVGTGSDGQPTVDVRVNNVIVKSAKASSTVPLNNSTFFYVGPVTVGSGQAYAFSYGATGKNLVPDPTADSNNPIPGNGTMICTSSGCQGGVS